MPMKDADEYRHPSPNSDPKELWGDTVWISTVDREANIFGINHFHFTNRNYARFEALYVIDGVQQQYGNKVPLDPEPDNGPWTDGILTYEVVEPQKAVRVVMDGPRFGFDLTYTGRFPMFDYFDHVNNPFATGMGGHNEQGMLCTGEFEIRGGPNKGSRRQLNSYSHRDHSWSHRFAEEPEWEWETKSQPGHYWPSVQTDRFHLNTFGILGPGNLPDGQSYPGAGFISTAEGGTEHIKGSSGEVLWADGNRNAASFRYEITLPDDEVIHVRTGRKYGQVKLWDRGENDLENRLDCYEPFFDFEIEESGEKGYGVCEYSVGPPNPRWLV